MPPTTYEILDLLRSAPEGELELAVRSDGRLVALLEPRSAEGPFCAARSLHANLWTPRAIRAGELPGLVLDPLLGVRADVLKERLPPPVALRLALDVLTGLDALHDAGDAHGALCPSAVLLDEEGRGRLVVLGPEPGPLETRLRYAAPEQLEGAASSFAGDVWAVGVLLHEWLTGAPLFEGRGWEVVARIAADDPHARRPAELAPLAPLFERLLARAPGERAEDACGAASLLIELAPRVGGLASREVVRAYLGPDWESAVEAQRTRLQTAQAYVRLIQERPQRADPPSDAFPLPDTFTGAIALTPTMDLDWRGPLAALRGRARRTLGALRPRALRARGASALRALRTGGASALGALRPRAAWALDAMRAAAVRGRRELGRALAWLRERLERR